MGLADGDSYLSLKPPRGPSRAHQIPLLTFQTREDPGGYKTEKGKNTLAIEFEQKVIKILNLENYKSMTISTLQLSDITKVKKSLTKNSAESTVMIDINNGQWQLNLSSVHRTRFESKCENARIQLQEDGKALGGLAANRAPYAGLSRATAKKRLDDMEFQAGTSKPKRVSTTTSLQPKIINSKEWEFSGRYADVASPAASPAAKPAAKPAKAPVASPPKPRPLMPHDSAPSVRPVFGRLTSWMESGSSSQLSSEAPIHEPSQAPSQASSQVSIHEPSPAPGQAPSAPAVVVLESTEPESQQETVNLCGSPPSRKSARVRSRPSPTKVLEPLVAPTMEFVEDLKTGGFVDLKYQFRDGRWDGLAVQEMARLQTNVYLDDSLVMFLLKYFLERHLPESFRNRTHLFGTFFFPSVCESPHESIAKWTAKLDISKSLIIIPVHHSSHWSVLVVANLDRWIATGTERPSLVLFDSLRGTVKQQNALYVKATRVIDAMLKSKSLKGVELGQVSRVTADVPAQKNLSDCGVFLVDFMNHLISQPELFLEKMKTATRSQPFKFSDFAPQQSFGRQELLVLLKDLCETHQREQEPEQSDQESELEMFENEK